MLATLLLFVFPTLTTLQAAQNAVQPPAMVGASRPADIAFDVRMIDPGYSESVAVADFNRDGRLDILSAEYWYELRNGAWVKHVIPSESHGHGIGARDVNGDKRNDIITPNGWFEAPVGAAPDAQQRDEPVWVFHPTNWGIMPVQPGTPPPPTQGPARAPEYAFMYVLDINKDGRNDVLTSMAHSYGVLWFEQLANGGWTRRVIDSTWANAHSSALADLSGDGQVDLVAAKRYFGRGGADPSEREPMGIYWYEFRPGPSDGVEWIRHIIEYGGRAGGGLQMVVQDGDGDGDLDVVTAGKTGLFLSESLLKAPRPGSRDRGGR